MKKHLIKVTIILSMLLLTLIPLSVSAATSGTCGENLTWTLDDRGTLTISGSGEMFNWKSYRDVPWCTNASKIYNIILDANLTSIGDYAFDSCRNVQTITIPNNVTYIGKSAFELCRNLNSVVIPDSVTYIGNFSFSSCDALTTITIPNNVTYIGESAFYNAENLSEINVNEKNKIYSSTNGILFDKNKTTLIQYPKGKKDTYYTIPSSVTRIEKRSFCGCYNLSNITISTNVTYIGNDAFGDCSNLTNMEIPDSVTYIGNGAFGGCNFLKKVRLSNNITSINDNTFITCRSLRDITIPESVTTIGNRAFYYAGLEKITIHENITTVGEEAFMNCTSLKQINWNTDRVNNTSWIFYYSGSSDGLSVTFGENVTKIPNSLFSSCKKLKNVIIPESVVSIGAAAFRNCNQLKVIYGGTKEQWNNISIDSSNEPLTSANITYKVETINLTYNLNGGNGKIETVEIEENSSTTISSSTPTKDGYTFLGWSISNSAKTPEYKTNDTITVGTENITLYAVWKKIICTKTQSLNGIFLVTPTGVELGNRVILVCYNDDRMVYVNTYVYAGETIIPFTTTETYDKVKVMVWENLESCVPLCEAENVPLN